MRLAFVILIILLQISIICLHVVGSTQLEELKGEGKEKEAICNVENGGSVCMNVDDDLDANTNIPYDKRNVVWDIEEQSIPRFEESETRQVIAETYLYMMKQVYSPSGRFAHSKIIQKDCKNHDALCSRWAAEGECNNNPGYMQAFCAPACQSCHQLDIQIRCAYNDTMETKAWKPNNDDLDSMFLNIVNHPYYQRRYPNTTVHSGPRQQIVKPEFEETLEYQERYHFQSLPWVVTIDHFLTNQECDTMIAYGSKFGYEQSNIHSGEDEDNTNENSLDGTYSHYQNRKSRSSSNTWCVDDCYTNPILESVHARMENLTSIPKENYEFMQLLKYEQDELYTRHHDYLPYLKERQPGVRILTMYMYLNDEGLVGGETAFPVLGIKIQPKKGRLVLWPNVFNDDPDAMDPLTDHEALPVKSGVKYGVNAWVHQRDFKEPYSRGCSG